MGEDVHPSSSFTNSSFLWLAMAMAMALALDFPLSYCPHLPCFPCLLITRTHSFIRYPSSKLIPAPVILFHGPHSRMPSSSSPTLSRFGQARSSSVVPNVGVFPELCEEAIQMDTPNGQGEDGPVELPTEVDPFQMPQVTALQTAASVLLTGTIAFLLFRSLRRRSQRAKEMRFRSSGVESIKEQARKTALVNLTKEQEIQVSPPNAGQTFLGAIVAGVIALVCYKFTTTVEASFAQKAVSANYSIRQLTITIRTIINGLCYLATFVFAANSIGLALYSLQLALNLDPPPPANYSSLDSKPVDVIGDSNTAIEAADIENNSKDEKYENL